MRVCKKWETVHVLCQVTCNERFLGICVLAESECTKEGRKIKKSLGKKKVFKGEKENWKKEMLVQLDT